MIELKPNTLYKTKIAIRFFENQKIEEIPESGVGRLIPAEFVILILEYKQDKKHEGSKTVTVLWDNRILKRNISPIYTSEWFEEIEVNNDIASSKQ